MKRNYIIMTAITLLSLTGCSWFFADDEELQKEPIIQPITDVLPVFSSDGQLARQAARIVTDNSGKFSYYDFIFQAYCPALTAFAPASDKNTHGSRYTQSFFNTPLELSVEKFSAGTNGIVSGVRVSSSSATDGVSILVEFNPSTKNFYYEQYFFLDDPDGNIQGPLLPPDQVAYPWNGILFYTARGNYGAKHLVAEIKSAALLDMSGSNSLQVFYDAEQYAGEWNGGGFGRGFVAKMYDNTYVDASTWPSFDGIDTPTTTQKFVLADLPDTVSYLRKVLKDWYTPGTFQRIIAQYYPPIGSLQAYPTPPDWKWINGVAEPATIQEAKDNWPCPEWLQVTQISD